MSTVRARLAIALAALVACTALAACGGGDDDSTGAAATSSTATASASGTSASGTGTTDASTDEDAATDEDASSEDEDEGSPESHIAPDAEVSAGLKRLKGVAATVAATGGGDEARDAVEKVWQPIEGTVKKNEPDLYLDVEDSFEQLSSGDAADAKRGARRLDQAVDAYLAKHPG